MRVIFFAYYFPPLGGIGSIRALGLARHLPEFGVDVTVVAPRTGTYGTDGSPGLPAGVEVVRTGSLEPGVLLGRAGRVGAPTAGPAAGRGTGIGHGLRSLVRRLLYVPDPNVGWVCHAVAAGIRESAKNRPDLILSSSPPFSAHLAGAWTSSRLGVPHVADFRDFFASQRLFGGWRARIDEALESAVLRRVRATIAATRGLARAVGERRPGPCFVHLNGYDEDDFAGDPPPVRSGPFTLVHVGTCYPVRRDPGPLFRAVHDVRDGGLDIRLRFVGAPSPGLVEAARREGVIDACTFVGFVTHREAVREMRCASALLLFLWAEDGPVGEGTVAGKTLEYLRAARPVLYVGPEGAETARILGRLGGAISRSDGDREGLADALRRLGRGEAPPPAPRDALLPFSRREQARRLAAWLPEVVA